MIQSQHEKALHYSLFSVTVCSVFFICFLPFHSQRLLKSYTETRYFKRTSDHKKFMRIWYFFSGILYYSSSAANPLIYSLLSRKFRVAFKLACLTRRSVRTTKERRYVFKSSSDPSPNKEENEENQAERHSSIAAYSEICSNNGRATRFQSHLHRTMCNCSNCSKKHTDSSESKDFDKMAEDILKSSLINTHV